MSDHPCNGCRHLRIPLEPLPGMESWCHLTGRYNPQRCAAYAPGPDYSPCGACVYAQWIYANRPFCEFGVEPADGGCVDRVVPEADGPPCDGCKHLAVVGRGREDVCNLTATQWRSPTRCRHFEPAPDYSVCRGCAHAAWDRPGRPCCTAQRSPVDGQCDQFEPREHDAPACPECGQDLFRKDGRVECSSGHSWRVRRRAGSVCPSRGREYATFGISEGEQRRVLYLCSHCGWSDATQRYAGPPRGRSRHGNQRWSPVTGRVLGG